MRLLVQAGTITALAVAIVACGGSSQAAEPANPTSQSQGESASSSVASEDIIVSQYANITRTFPTFDYMAEYSRRIAERTNGRVEIQMTSFAELGLAGPDTLRLIGDGTLEFGEVYSGYVGGDLVQSLGGEDQFIPFAEVYAALERGILDAAVTEGLAGNGQRWYEVTDYLVGPIISLGNTWVVINQERWDTLPPDIQQIFLEESERHDRELLAYAVGEWERKAIDENVVDGLIHQEFSPEMKRALRDAGINQVIPQCVKRAGGPDSKAAKLFNGKNSPSATCASCPTEPPRSSKRTRDSSPVGGHYDLLVNAPGAGP